MKVSNVLAEKAKIKPQILQLQLLRSNVPAGFHLSSVTAIIMAWHKFLSLSLSASSSIRFTTIFVPVCFNSDIAWYHCCTHVFDTDVPRVLLLHAPIVMFLKVHPCIDTNNAFFS